MSKQTTKETQRPCYAVMAVKSALLDVKGQNVSVRCFQVPGAEHLAVNDHVKMFGWYNVVMRYYQIHELKSGIMIGQGRTKDAALADVVSFFKATDPKYFFAQAAAMGVATKYPEITLAEVLVCYQTFRDGSKKNGHG